LNYDDDHDDDGEQDGTPEGKPASKISLSCLLNVIDGVSAKEGRVLIMTTNCPEKLDEALMRPGRVDMKIAFTLCSREQVTDIYTRMYSSNTTSVSEVAPSPTSQSKLGKVQQMLTSNVFSRLRLPLHTYNPRISHPRRSNLQILYLR
jgi:chaperone BCS1